MARKRKPNLPPAGSAYAFPLEDGRYAVCRVLLDAASDESKQQWDAPAILVACSAWIGDRVPEADDPALRPILYKTHHSWRNEPEVLWLDEEPPADFIPLGLIPPTAEETAVARMRFGTWKSLTIQPLAQWRWDNARDEVIARDAAEEAAAAEQRSRMARERQEYLRRVSLTELREHQFFARWKDYPPQKLIVASREIMSDTVEQLIGLGPTAPERERMAVLRECIEAFNRLDADTHFIETVEREDICEEFEAIVHACGLGKHEDLADEWREW
jgi:hypothetical protein